MQYFKEGDIVRVTSYGDETDCSFIGKVGPIKRITTHRDGLVNYFVDINVPGLFFWDLICYEGEFEHVKEETND